jgi:uncharacterized membrane protein
MTHHHPPSTARIAGHPLHPMLIPFPLTFFVSALVTDILYLQTGDAGWATGSWWLLLAGLVTAVLAAVTGFADYLGSERVRRIGWAKAHMYGNILAVALEAANLLIRDPDPAAAIGGAGLILSIVAVAILGFTGWAGGELVYKHGVGVEDRAREGN